jgi:hypothetical protein
MAYQTSDVSNIHSVASDAKLVLSNPTTSWTLKNNFVDNKFVVENQTLPNIINIDPTTGATDLVDTIRTTQSKLKSNTGFNTNLLSSLGMGASYDIIFPPTPPTATQTLIFDGVNYIWDTMPPLATLASDGTGVSLVSDGTAPTLVIYSLRGVGGTTVTQVGNNVVIDSSPNAFIANHTMTAVDYNNVSYTPVKWDDIVQNSNDVVYNSTTDEFTTAITGDYRVSFAFFGKGLFASYLAAMRNETTLINYVQDMSSIPTWTDWTYVLPRNPFPPIIPYFWNNQTSTKAWFSKVVHLTVGDIFTLGIEPDPSFPITINDGVLLSGTDDRPLTNCSIRRLL